MRLYWDEDILQGKLAQIDEALRKIETVSRERAHGLAEWMADDLCVLYLQHGVQAAIDLANHLIAENRWPTPKTATQSFEVLAREGVVTDSLQQTLTAMVGFRNIAVHTYDRLDMAVVRGIVSNHLKDFRRFSRAIIEATLGDEGETSSEE